MSQSFLQSKASRTSRASAAKICKYAAQGVDDLCHSSSFGNGDFIKAVENHSRGTNVNLLSHFLLKIVCRVHDQVTLLSERSLDRVLLKLIFIFPEVSVIPFVFVVISLEHASILLPSPAFH